MVVKPAEQTPASTCYLMSILSAICSPPGVINVVNGFGVEAGKPLASSNRIAKIAFTGETTTGRLIMQYAFAEPDPGDLGTRREEPQHLLQRRPQPAADDYQDKALEGFTMFALNQGEVCTCPLRFADP